MRFLLFILIIVLIFALLIRGNAFEDKEGVNTLTIGPTTVQVEVADTDEERTLGLSGRESLVENSGLLFVFETEGYHGIWMKDMNFPIDIAWLDKNKKIIHIEHNVSPETYPKVFNPPTPSLYVLETNAGFFQKFNIGVGNTAQLLE